MADLYDEGSLPGWMRPENAELMEKGNSGPYPAWRPASTHAPQTDQSIIPPEGISARSLIDEDSLPSWVQGNQQTMHVIGGSTPVTPDSQGNFSAASLIQPDDMPDWIKSFQQPSQPSVSQNNVWNRNEQSSLSASSLLDENSLPTWLHEEADASGHPGQAPAGNYGLAGSSLIDPNALPGWMISYETQQQSEIQSMGNVRPLSTNGTPPRVEGVRVPSRPRGEIASQEQSAVAANVFSSVLGVASAAPYFPSAEPVPQWNTPSQNVFVPSQGFGAGHPEPTAGSQWNVPSQPPGFASVSSSQAYNAGNQVGQQGAYPAGAYAGYMGTGVPPIGTSQSGMPQQPPASGPAIPVEPSMTGSHTDKNTAGTKPAKRGFIETIRSWFS
jgi:hypothetical protein